ncbi:C2 calcium-dependent domain-containing protein 4A, partial [Camelus dromedarius]
PSGRRFLRASEGLLRRALWARRSCSLARARSVSSGDEDDNEDDNEDDERRTRPLSPPSRPSLPPGQTRRPRGAVVRRSRRAVLEQDLCLDGLTEDEVRRLAVRVKAENRGRLLGRGELLLGPLLPL